jgi:hypothetical protein
MRKGIIVSAALHLGVIGAAMVTWPNALSQSEDALPTVPIELISIADATNIQAAVRELPPPREPAPVEVERPTFEFEPDPVVVEALPPDPVPEPEPEPEPEVIAEPEPEPPPPPPQPRERPAPQREEFDLDSVIALLDNRAAETQQPQDAPQEEEARRGIGDRNAMTMSLVDALKAQMYECWSPPIGAPNAEELIVFVDIYLAPNGALARPPQLAPQSRAAAASNPHMRAAAEAALRAVNICAPYRNLPQDQYAAWRDVEMEFNPALMAGR